MTTLLRIWEWINSQGVLSIAVMDGIHWTAKHAHWLGLGAVVGWVCFKCRKRGKAQ